MESLSLQDQDVETLFDTRGNCGMLEVACDSVPTLRTAVMPVSKTC